MDRLILREQYTPDELPTVAGRTLTLRLATIGRMYRPVTGQRAKRERIEAGAFREPLARPRGVLRFRHRGEHPGEPDDLDNFHGVMTALREESGAVMGDFELFEGPREDKLLRLVEQRAVTGASMSAIVAESRQLRDDAGPFTSIVRIRQVNGASITPAPGYDDAGVVAMREADPGRAQQLRAAADAERAALQATRALLAAAVAGVR